jgi:hypothetical protein
VQDIIEYLYVLFVEAGVSMSVSIHHSITLTSATEGGESRGK